MAILRSGRPLHLVHRWTSHCHLSTTFLGEHMFEELIHRIDDLAYEFSDFSEYKSGLDEARAMLEDIRFEVATTGDILEWAGYDFAEIV